MLWLTGCLLLAEPPALVGGGGFDTLGGEPVAVGVGYDSACVAYEQGVACTDDDLPSGDYVAVDGGLFGYCAVAGDGALVCSGSMEKGMPERADRLAVGDGTGCLILDGALDCWGDNYDGLADPPGGEDWESLTIGAYNGCAVSEAGALRCWGDDGFDVTTPPRGSFLAAATASFDACAVTTDGELQCWGSTDGPPPRDGSYTAITAGDYHYCALDEEGGVRCWGDDDQQQASPPDAEFRTLDCGGDACCGITTDAEVECWGSLEGVVL